MAEGSKGQGRTTGGAGEIEPPNSVPKIISVEGTQVAIGSMLLIDRLFPLLKIGTAQKTETKSAKPSGAAKSVEATMQQFVGAAVAV